MSFADQKVSVPSAKLVHMQLGMALGAPLVEQIRRFYDGGLPASADHAEVPADPTRDPRIVLERLTEHGAESFQMQRRIAYRDRELGEIVVPASTAAFRTDLTSVPALFTWLVPKTGAHLPAALLHDGLVDSPEERAAGAASYLSTEGHEIDRAQADRIFRDAMADTGTGLVRRWIVWSAVTLATLFVGTPASWTPLRRWWQRGAAALTIVVVLVLGYWATADLLDRQWWGSVPLPWMGDRPLWLELVGGLAGALFIPTLLGLLWGRFWQAGVINGVLLAVLIHLTLGLVAISLGYLALERAVRSAPRLTTGIAAVCFVAAGVFLVWLTLAS